MAVDFKALKNVKVDDVKPPPAYPAGTYFGTIKSREWGETRFANRETGEKEAALRLAVTLTGAGDDVDPDDLAEIEYKGKVVTKEYRVNDPAGLYALTQTMKSVLGEDTARGLDVIEAVEQLPNSPVMITITQRASNKEGEQRIYNDVGRISGETTSD